MYKTVGAFEGEVGQAYPCGCDITCRGKRISFTHRDLADLAHLITEMQRYAKERLPKHCKEEV